MILRENSVWVLVYATVATFTIIAEEPAEPAVPSILPNILEKWNGTDTPAMALGASIADSDPALDIQDVKDPRYLLALADVHPKGKTKPVCI